MSDTPQTHPFEQAIPVQSRALGDFELTALSDGNYWLDGGGVFGVVPKALWQKRMPANEQNLVATGLNALLVRTGKHTVLIETGAGNKLDERMQRIYQPQQRLLRSLEEARVAPDEIDIVVNTHLHFDHCGWNTVRRGDAVVATFPRARYYVQQGELEVARRRDGRDAPSYLDENYVPLVESGQMQLLQGDTEIVPGISVEVFPGHTRHMQAVVIRSGGRTACYISDLIPTTAHLDLNWVLSYDLYPVETIASRRRFYARAAPEQWLVCFTHDPRVPWAYVEERKPGKYEARTAGS